MLDVLEVRLLFLNYPIASLLEIFFLVKEKKLSQNALAILAGVTNHSVAKLESGANVSVFTLYQCSCALN